MKIISFFLLQNESRSLLSGPGSDCALVTSASPNACRPGAGCEGGVTFAGAEVEVSEGVSELSDESALIRALTLEDGPQALNNTTVTQEEDAETVLPSGHHVDHQYCSRSSEEPRCAVELPPQETESSTNEHAEITFKSFTCPGGEVEVADGSVVREDAVMTGDSPLEDPSQSSADESEHTERPGFPSPHVEHPYCQDELESSASDSRCTQAAESDSSVDVNSEGHIRNHSCANISSAVAQPAEERGEITFKSFNFSGAEVEIENTLDVSDLSMLIKSLTLQDNIQFLSSGFSDCDGGTTVALSGEHADHLYCHVHEGGPTDSESEALSTPQLSSADPPENEVQPSKVCLDGSDHQSASNSEENKAQSDRSRAVSPQPHSGCKGGSETSRDVLPCLGQELSTSKRAERAEEALGAPSGSFTPRSAEVAQSSSEMKAFLEAGEGSKSSRPQAAGSLGSESGGVLAQSSSGSRPDDLEVDAPGPPRPPGAPPPLSQAQAVGGAVVALCGNGAGSPLVQDGDAETGRGSALGASVVHSGSEVLRAESLHEVLADAVPLHSLWSAVTLQDPSTPSRSVLQVRADSLSSH